MVFFMFFWVCIYSYTEEERCASHTRLGRSCDWKICFSPPPPISLAEDSATAGVQRDRDDGDGLGNSGVEGYRGGRDGWSDGGYILERPWGR